MRDKVIIILLIINIIILSVICAIRIMDYYNNSSVVKESGVKTEEPKSEEPMTPCSPSISTSEAFDIALKKAQLSSNKVRYDKVYLDYEDGVQVYEVDFISGEKEYEVVINAQSGEIVEYTVERLLD